MIKPKLTKSTIINSIFCFLMLTLGAYSQTVYDKNDPQATKLVVLERLWNEAQVHRDERALEGMIADSFVDTEWDGEVSERGKFLADIKDPQFKPTQVSIQDLKVNLYPNAGVVTGVYHTKGSYNGKPYDHVGRFTDTWVFEDGKWECVASHTSLLKK
jgi:ketosteroid isomerase-like protein